MPAANISTLREQALQFQDYLATVKAQTPLNPPRVIWYPWETLSQIGVLDTFLQNDRDALKNMVGRDPVLDVGCGDGDIAFFLESLGMQVDAVDYAPTNNNALLGVHALKKKLGSSIRIHEVDLDARPTLPSSDYGFTVMLGVLYHLKNPFLVLEALARASRYIFLSTRIASLSPDRKTNFGALPLAYLVEEEELNNDETNYWIFSEKALQRVLRRTGWDVIHYTTFGSAATADPVSEAGDARAYILAKSRVVGPQRGFRLRQGWHPLEDNYWRWTERIFSIELDTSASLQPGTLRFAFQLPEVVFAQSPTLTLLVRVNGTPLVPGIYSMPGGHEYIGTMPPTDSGVVTVEFELDHAIGPTDQDRRELGLIVELSGASPIELSYSSK